MPPLYQQRRMKMDNELLKLEQDIDSILGRIIYARGKRHNKIEEHLENANIFLANALGELQRATSLAQHLDRTKG